MRRVRFRGSNDDVSRWELAQVTGEEAFAVSEATSYVMREARQDWLDVVESRESSREWLLALGVSGDRLRRRA